jgi:hypothetical protein
MANVLDVIDNFWGTDPLARIRQAGLPELEEFGEHVNRFYDAHEVVPVGEGELRTYLGGLVAGNFQLSVQTGNFYNGLLYAHSTIVPDPLACWYFNGLDRLGTTLEATYSDGTTVDQSEVLKWRLTSFGSTRANLVKCREILGNFVSDLLSLRRLIERQIVILVSQAHVVLERNEELASTASRDAQQESFNRICANPPDELHPVWDNLRGLVFTPKPLGQNSPADESKVLWARGKEASYHINKNLLIAESGQGSYLPMNDTDATLMLETLRGSARTLGLEHFEFAAASATSLLQLPALEGLTPEEFASVRADEDAFDQFRKRFRRAFGAEHLSSQAINDVASELEGEIADLRHRLHDSVVLRNALREEGITLALPFILAVATSPTWEKLGTASAIGLARLLQRLRNRAKGSNEVLVSLARMKRRAPDAISTVVRRSPGRVFMGAVRTGRPPHGTNPSSKGASFSSSPFSLLGRKAAPPEFGHPNR